MCAFRAFFPIQDNADILADLYFSIDFTLWLFNKTKENELGIYDLVYQY